MPLLPQRDQRGSCAYGRERYVPVVRRWLVVVVLALAGCGGDEQRRVADVSDVRHRVEVERDPYALTCGDLARQSETSTNQRMVIHVEFTLAAEPGLRRRVAQMTANRVGRSIYWALTEVCKGRDASFKPGRDAVQAVRQGRYLVQPRPQSWSDPERWSKP
jgi:hypothetical protein